MRRLRQLLTLAACVSISTIAQAGPNENGTLILHSNANLVYCSDNAPYDGDSDLSACDGAVTNAPSGRTVVWWTLAAFDSGSSPRLAGVTFGVQYDEYSIYLLDLGPSGDFELSTGDWPSTGSGTAITWGTAQTTQVVEVYWFAGYEYYYNDVAFELIPHPTQGGSFADDDVPSNLDPIAAYGAIGFNQHPGNLPCPAGGAPVGACCFDPCGECQQLAEDDCHDGGGYYLGDDIPCDPGPCEKPPAACCLPDGSCLYIGECACDEEGGEIGGYSCDPNPCQQPVGACCFCDGHCELLTEWECDQIEDTYYWGNGTECDPSPCEGPEGACCFEDGSCIYTLECDCEEQGGEYLGDFVGCDPNPCPQPTGACCDDEGNCEVVEKQTCEAGGGEYQGDDSGCEPNPCEVTPTEDSSWGRLKARYR